MIIDGWHFEVIAVRCRKVSEYGDTYSAIANITVADGEPHVEGLLSTIAFSRKDRAAITKYIKSMGYDNYYSSNFKNGKRVITNQKL